MKAKNKRTAPPSMHARVKAYMAAEAEARKHATEGIALADAGDLTKARASAKKAAEWVRKMQALEQEAIGRDRRLPHE